jgi:anti-sigma B factor antagonist
MAKINSKTISATNSTPPLMLSNLWPRDYPVCLPVTQGRQSRHTACRRSVPRKAIVLGNGTPSIGQPRSVGSRTVQSHFRLEVRNEGRSTVIVVSGELDLASSPALQEELDRVAASDSQMLIIDLRELDFMDSTGLSVLVRAHQRIEEQGRQLAMVKGPQQVQRLLSLTGVAERLRLVDTPEELLGRD